MMGKSSIEWTEQTWNPIRGCSKISPGCENCYAMQIAARFSGPGQPYQGLAKRNPVNWTGQLRIIERAILAPIRRKVPTTYFVNSMSDLFHERMPPEVIDKLLAVMWEAHWHTFQVLTKRADVMAEYFADPMRRSKIAVAAWELLHARDREKAKLVTFDDIYDELTWPLPNLWLGVSVENQEYAERRIPLLLKTPAAVRFLSCEPLLGPIDLERAHRTHERLPNWPEPTRVDWVIAGGESGRNARPCHPGWVRSIRDQCVAAGVPFFFKQWGEWSPLSTVDGRQELPFGEYVLPNDEHNGFGFSLVGKKSAGRVLDGRTWDEMPKREEALA